MSFPFDPQRIYDVLVEECGAHDDEWSRAAFAHHFPACVEYRFQGDLGYGGKVWWSSGRLYVNCYREDETPNRTEAIARANERLSHFCKPEDAA